MKILEDVTESQKEAISHIDGPLLVIAGAGSGKTRVITRRVGYLIENGVSPYNVLAITFTNKAANEIKERLREFINIKGMWVSTYHAMCARILRMEIEHLGYTNDFSIYDTGDQVNCVKSVMDELKLDPKSWRPRQIAATISNAKNELVSVEEYSKYKTDFYGQTVAKIYARYQKVLVANNALDFNDLLCKVVDLLKNHPQVLEKYQEKFRYILIDEYQDTNNAQYMITQLLAQRYKNICATGDPDQSIYGWRGANIQNILSFEKDYPDAKVVSLEQNYRSTKTILHVASEIIKNNRSRRPKSLWTENDQGSKVKVIHCEDENVEAEEIVSRISDFANNGNKYSDLAIFYRTNAQSRVIETCLLQKGIPYTIVGSVEFFQRKEIRDIIAYLKIFANPNADLPLERIINVPPRGIGPTSVKRLKELAYIQDKSLLEMISHVHEIKDIKARSANAIKNFLNTYSQISKYPAFPVTEFLTKMIDGIGYLDYLEKSCENDGKERIENVRELVNAAREYDIASPDGSLTGFLETISLISDIDKWDEDAESVTLMTLHAAKGLEFPIIFITGFEENLLPHSQSIDSDDDIEEERRLCYVGITRAQKDLFLTHASRRFRNGQRTMCVPSRFLDEIPVDSKEEIDKTNNYLALDDYQSEHEQKSFGPFKPEKFVYNKDKETGISQTKDDNAGNDNFKPGDMVLHDKFGRGIIIKIVTSTNTATINFNRVGMKKLILKYAKLEKFKGYGR